MKSFGHIQNMLALSINNATYATKKNQNQRKSAVICEEVEEIRNKQRTLNFKKSFKRDLDALDQFLSFDIYCYENPKSEECLSYEVFCKRFPEAEDCRMYDV
jgi:hypothetical protein